MPIKRAPHRRERKRADQSWGLGLLWLVACLIASYVAMGYEFRPGRLGPQPSSWPSGSTLTRSTEHPTVMAFLHPRCVCTRATVKQLVRTITAYPGAKLVVSVFVPPAPADSHGWIDGEYAQTIRAALPSAHLVPDRGGREARRFGALTSGTILVYDTGGREIFRGGITNRRGGEEDNPGLRQFAQLLRGEPRLAHAGTSPVFGCPLVTDREANK